jgi:hypothetical protein
MIFGGPQTKISEWQDGLVFVIDAPGSTRENR